MMDFEKGYKTIIARIIERGTEWDWWIVQFYGREKVIGTIRDEIYFLPNYAIDRALRFFPKIKKKEMFCYMNLKDKASS